LHIDKGDSLSCEFHRVKEETIRLPSGVLDVPLMKHCKVTVEDCDVLVTSTAELDDVVSLADRYGRANTPRLLNGAFRRTP
jgi:hypothetical protein